MKLSKPLWRSTGDLCRERGRDRAFCRGWQTFPSSLLSSSIDGCNEVCTNRLSKYAQLVSWIKVYPSDVKQPWNVSWSKYRRTLRRCHAVQRLIHPLSFSILLLLEIETERTYSNIFARISNNPREFFPRSFALRGMFLSFLCCLY